MRNLKFLPALAVALIVAVSCASLEGPAKAVLEKVDRAWVAVRADAAKYAPEAMESVDKTLAEARRHLSDRDYSKAIAEGKRLLSDIDGLKAAIAAKKVELDKAWASASARVPGMVDAAKAKAETLSRAAKLPPGVTKDMVAAAKSAAAEAEAAWTDAVKRFESGELKDAMDKVAAAKKRIAEAMSDLGDKTAVPE